MQVQLKTFVNSPGEECDAEAWEWYKVIQGSVSKSKF